MKPHKVLNKVAKFISSKEKLCDIGLELEVRKNDIDSFLYNNQHDINGAALDMLAGWWENSAGESAKWDSLNDVLHKELSQDDVKELRKDISKLC